MEPSAQWIWDNDTAVEAQRAYDSYLRFGLVNDPVAFETLCQCYDALLGRKSSTPAAPAIIKDRSREWYILLTVYLLRETRFTIQELAKIAEEVVEYKLWDKDYYGNKKKNKKFSPIKPDHLYNLLIGFSRNCHFEPKWHMERRGDTRPLPNQKGKDLWGFLRRMYTDPEYCRMRMPDNIARIASLYPGYEECIAAARRDGQVQMRKLYGNNVDLSLITEIHKKDNEDFDGTSLMGLIRNGNIAAALAKK